VESVVDRAVGGRDRGGVEPAQHVEDEAAGDVEGDPMIRLAAALDEARCDVGVVTLHPETHVVQAVGFNYLRSEWKLLDKSLEADFAALHKLNPGDLAGFGRDRADQKWVVAFTNGLGPSCPSA